MSASRLPTIPVIDGHNDFPWTSRTMRGYSVEGMEDDRLSLQTDIPALRQGGVAGQFWSVWVHSAIDGAESVQATLEQIDFVHRMAARYPETFRLASTADEVRRSMKDGRIASLIGVEGGSQINGSLAVLRSYARLGARYMTLTWTSSSNWADSATDNPVNNGLTGFGRDVIAEINRIGMLVDLAHTSVKTMHDALDASAMPLINSHAGAYAVNPHPRNVPDDVIRRVAAAGGVHMVTFVPSFMSAERSAWSLAGKEGPMPPVDVRTVADHVDHVRSVAGIDGVGLGGDFDGSDAMPDGLDTVAGYPNLFAELSSRGWTNEDLNKLAHENVLRVLESADENYRSFLQAGAK
ncbi:dipeptidase [Arthrobacter sp. APC 3897]|uniref:dipeptidase n=1 Tax=Arthrobacter sp. APC 3897 TaxID=3035204 RepID=UPI0025B3E10C|nr:dipeptidase [Arthrobacter sp. APC 3897]MDN3482416.1 dipeptidase [Arthrobacter sp. APC 3897]